MLQALKCFVFLITINFIFIFLNLFWDLFTRWGYIMRYFYIRKCLSEINAPPMIGYLFIFPVLKTWQLTSTQRNEWKQHTTNLKRRICLGWKLRTLTCDFHSWNRCWRKTGWSPQKILWTSARQLFNVNAIVQLPGHQKRKKNTFVSSLNFLMLEFS